MASDTLLTDDLKERIEGQEHPLGEVEIEKDHIRMFSTAIRDKNPLWSDEQAARRRRYGGLIGPPTLTRFVGFAARPRIDWQVGLPGTVSVDGGSEWEYFQPIRPGDRITVRRSVEEVFERQGASGPLLFVIMSAHFANQFGETVVVQRSTSIRYDALAAGKSTDAGESGRQLAAAGPGPKPRPRSDVQLAWEDVEEGTELPPLEVVTSSQDLVKYAAASRDFSEIHYDREFAQSVGLPGVILHGALKAAYLGRLVTDWIGDGGDLKKLGCQHRGMDRPGDVTTCKGTVKAKRVVASEHLVDCTIWLENDDGRRTAPGWATVALPLRKS